MRKAIRGGGARGQSLVEFALAVPIFILLVTGLVEFGVLYNNVLTVQYASRQGVSAAAEAGAQDGADCSALDAVEKALRTPVNRSYIDAVSIFESDTNGNPVAGHINRYVRSGVLDCPGTGTEPYTLASSEGYPEETRKDSLTSGLDIIGVKIEFTYHGLTPLGAGRTWSIDDASTLRVEPKQ